MKYLWVVHCSVSQLPLAIITVQYGMVTFGSQVKFVKVTGSMLDHFPLG